MIGHRISTTRWPGPTTPVMACSGSVCSADPDRAAVVAERLECGTEFVNDHLTLQPYMPFGGMK